MNNLTWIGNVSINISLILYLVTFATQIVHNQKLENLVNLSIGFHILLYVSYSFDLVYAFANSLPIQYKILSVVGLLYILIQQIQLYKVYKLQKDPSHAKLYHTMLLISSILFFITFFLLAQKNMNPRIIFICGFIDHSCCIVSYVPQIIKNKQIQAANGMSIYYVYFGLILSFFDILSAWSLNLDWLNKFVGLIYIILSLILLIQYRIYSKSNKPYKKLLA